MLKRHLACIAFALVAVGLVSCDDASETGRTIVAINDFNGGAPVQSDVLFNNGTDPPYVPEDIIPVSFTARYYNGFVTGVTHSQVVIDRYHIDWTRTDGGTGALASRDEAASITLTVGDQTDASLRLTTWTDKTGPILAPLVGSLNAVVMRADVTFFGREVGTTKEVELKASVSVDFADLANN